MSILIILLVVSLVIAGGFLGAFFWAMNNGQYDDVDTPSVRILNDED
jgi:cbb3-type cytochrome oxidase maturation protein